MTTSLPRPVTKGVVAMLASGNNLIPVPVQMGYSTAEPFAVEMDFYTSSGNHVDWLVDRGLLADGFVAPSGEMDVIVRPHEDETLIVVELTSPSGHAVFEFPAADVREFLQHTYDVVPPGAETRFMEIPDTVAEFLRMVDDE
jgi:hypothetical protein